MEKIQLVVEGTRYIATPGHGLTPRQTEATLWTCEGKTNEEIAAIMGTSVRTAKAHAEGAEHCLNAANKAALAATAVMLGIVRQRKTVKAISAAMVLLSTFIKDPRPNTRVPSARAQVRTTRRQEA